MSAERKSEGRAFMTSLAATLVCGILSTEGPISSANPIGLIGALFAAQLLQKVIFGWRFFPLEKTLSHEIPSGSEVYFRGNFLASNLKAKKEKKFLESVYGSQGPVAAKVFMFFLAALVIFLFRRVPELHVRGTTVLHWFSILAVIPVASFSHYLIPLFFNGAAVIWAHHSGQGIEPGLIFYCFFFFTTCALHSGFQRRVLLSDDGKNGFSTSGLIKGGLAAALTLIVIYGALDLFLPDSTPEKSRVLMKAAHRLNRLAGSQLARSTLSEASSQGGVGGSMGGADPNQEIHILQMGQGQGASGQDPGSEGQLGGRNGSGNSPQGSLKVSLDQRGSISNGATLDSRSLDPSKHLRERLDQKTTETLSDQSKGEIKTQEGVEDSKDSSPKNAELGTSGVSGGGLQQQSQGGPSTGQGATARGKVVPPDPTLVSEAVLMALVALAKFALVLSALGLVLWFFTRPSRVGGKKQKGPSKLTAESARQLADDIKRAFKLNFHQREGIIKSYQIFLNVMAAAQVPKEAYLPPSDYAHQLSQHWPEYGARFNLITDVFSDVFYGQIEVASEQIDKYEGAFRTIVKDFLR